MASDEKLEKFQSAVFAEIETKADSIQKQALSDQEQALLKSQNEQQHFCDDLIREKTKEIQKEYKRKAAQSNLDSKRNILKERNRITEDVFSAVSEKLRQFSETEKYEEYLLSMISEFSRQYSLTFVQIMVGKNDMARAEKIKQAYLKPCEVLLDPSITLGGFIAKDEKDGIYYDESLSQKLSEQKDYFVKNSDLFL